MDSSRMIVKFWILLTSVSEGARAAAAAAARHLGLACEPSFFSRPRRAEDVERTYSLLRLHIFVRVCPSVRLGIISRPLQAERHGGESNGLVTCAMWAAGHDHATFVLTGWIIGLDFAIVLEEDNVDSRMLGPNTQVLR